MPSTHDDLVRRLEARVVSPVAAAWTAELRAAAKSVVDDVSDRLATAAAALQRAFAAYRPQTGSAVPPATAQAILDAVERLAAELDETSSALTAAKSCKNEDEKSTIDRARAAIDQASVDLVTWRGELGLGEPVEVPDDPDDSAGPVVATESRPPPPVVTVVIQEAPYLRLAPGQTILHAINAAPPGGVFGWQIAPGVVVPQGPVDRPDLALTATAVGTARVEVRYSVGPATASDQIVLDVVAPRIAADGPLDLGKVRRGQTSPTATLTLNNTGELDLTIEALALAGDDAAAFQLVPPDRSGATIRPRESLTVGLRFRPTATRGYLASLAVRSNDPSRRVLSVGLVGAGKAPRIQVGEQLAFGPVVVGERATRQLVIANIGDDELRIGALRPDGATLGPSVELPASLTVAPGSAVAVAVAVAPTRAGEQAGTLTIDSDDPDRPSVTVTLAATGVQPKIGLTARLEFADTPRGRASRPLDVIVWNAGAAPLRIAGLELAGASPGDFEAALDALRGAVVEPAQSRTLAVTFRPTAGGDRDAALSIRSNDPDQPTVTCALAGSCRFPAIEVGTIAPFGPLAVGETSTPVDLALTNHGDAPLRLDLLALGGVDRCAFDLDVSGIPDEAIPAGETRTLRLTTRPTAARSLAATLHVVCDDPGRPRSSVELAATGYDIRELTVPPEFAPGAEELDIAYAIDDPGGGVTKVELEIVHQATGAVLHTIAPAPPLAGRQRWNGAIAPSGADPDGFVTYRRRPYLVRLTVSRDGDAGPRRKEAAFTIKPCGDIEVWVRRSDGAPLPGRARLALARGSTTLVAAVDAASEGPTGDRAIFRGLEPGDYTVRIVDLADLLAAQQPGAQPWRIAPTRTGELPAIVTVGERTRIEFTLTRYTRVQFIAFDIEPAAEAGVYRSYDDDLTDLRARCTIMKQAIDTAATHPRTDSRPDVLKVFMAPEFFFRGKGGGYDLELVDEIPRILRGTSGEPRYADWVFVYGTAIGFIRHEEPGTGAARRHGVTIAGAALGAVRWTVRVVAGAGSASVCERIPDGRIGPLRWKVGQGGNEVEIIGQRVITRGAEYELELAGPGAPNPLVVGAAELVEPVTTEILNVAMVQRGGAAGGGDLRDVVVYKEYISAIDFLGANNGIGDVFHRGDGSGRAVDIHGAIGRRVIPIEGSRDLLGVKKNPSAAGGPSEVNRSGLGGGSLFTMAGVNFGLEVCLDHVESRLHFFYRYAAAPGDPRMQVQLIPSWGASIADGAIATSPAGLVFNVDGPDGSAAAQLTGPRFRCRHPEHAAQFLDPGLCQWFACPVEHPHFQGTGPNCAHCGAALTQVSRCASPYHSYTTDDPCPLCQDPVAPYYTCSACLHSQFTPGDCAKDPSHGPAGLAGYLCGNADLHFVPAGTPSCPVCSAVLGPPVGLACLNIPPHPHFQGTYGDCTVCGQSVELEPLIQDTAAVDGLPDQPDVPDGDGVFVDDLVTTTREKVDTSSGLTSTETTTEPGGARPIDLTALGPASTTTTDPGTGTTTEVWDARQVGPARLGATRTTVVTSTTTGTETITTTEITTTLRAEITATQAQLFADDGVLTFYPAVDLPDAEVV